LVRSLDVGRFSATFARVEDEWLSTDDDTGWRGEEGGEGVNNIIRTEIDLTDKETTKLGCYLPLAVLVYHTNT